MSNSVRVVITGGRGFIGRQLAKRLEERGELLGHPISAVAIFDLPDGDICDPAATASAVEGARVVFHLASMVSGECERDFDSALRTNLDGTRNVLEACRGTGAMPRLVFASTFAAFGGVEMPETVTDTTKLTPQTTYGIAKAASELLINDYTRKGFLDGRSARLPTVIVRPGPPNAAASAFASSVIKEPLAGRDYSLPVDLETRMPVVGERTVVECLVRLAEIEPEAIGDDRALNLPSISVTARELVESLRRVAGDRQLGRITVEPDPAVVAIVATWATRATADRARAFGLPAGEDIDSIVRAYIETWLD